MSDNGLISFRDGGAREVLRLARCAFDGEAGDVREMASYCVQDVLAMEVAQARPSSAAAKYPPTGPPDGTRKPHVG